MNFEIANLALAAPAEFVVSLAMLSGMPRIEQQTGSSPAIARLYLVFVQPVLLRVLTPIAASIFIELSNKALLIRVGAFLIGLPLVVVVCVSAANRKMPKNLHLAGWGCGLLLIILVAVRYKLRH